MLNAVSTSASILKPPLDQHSNQNDPLKLNHDSTVRVKMHIVGLHEVPWAHKRNRKLCGDGSPLAVGGKFTETTVIILSELVFSGTKTVPGSQCECHSPKSAARTGGDSLARAHPRHMDTQRKEKRLCTRIHDVQKWRVLARQSPCMVGNPTPYLPRF